MTKTTNRKAYVAPEAETLALDLEQCIAQSGNLTGMDPNPLINEL